MVVRSRYAPLVPFLDPRLATLATGVDPYRSTDETPAALEALRARVEAAGPDLLVSCAYTRTLRGRVAAAPGRGAPRAPRSTTGLARRRSTTLATSSLPELDLDGAGRARSRWRSPRRRPRGREEPRAGRRASSATRCPAAEPRSRFDDAACAPGARRTWRSARARSRAVRVRLPGRHRQQRLKGWPPESYAAQVVAPARRHGLPVLLTGLPGEAAHMEAVARPPPRTTDVPPGAHVGDARSASAPAGPDRLEPPLPGHRHRPHALRGALGVPVVAVFGGGHWPRFLPRARRSFVATQELPCFGCGLGMLAARARLHHGRRRGVVREGIDWILGDGPDERRIDRGHRGRAGAGAGPARARGRTGTTRSTARARGDWGGGSSTRSGGSRSSRRSRPRRHEDAVTLAALLHVTEEDSPPRLRNMEALQQIVDEKRRVIDEQQAMLARRSVKLAAARLA